MKISNLQLNQEFTNYIALCAALEIKPTGGLAKKENLTELARFVDLEKISSRGYKIKEIYTSAIPKPIVLTSREGSLWLQNAEIVCLDYLARKAYLTDENTYQALLTDRELSYLIGLCNGEFYRARTIHNRDLYQNGVNQDFFMETSGKIKDVLKSLKSSLTSRKILTINKVYVYKTLRGVEEYIADDKLHAHIVGVLGKYLVHPLIDCKSEFIVAKKGKGAIYYGMVKDHLKGEPYFIRGVAPKNKFLFNDEMFNRLEELKKCKELVTGCKYQTNETMLKFISDKMIEFTKGIKTYNKELIQLSFEEYQELINDYIRLTEEIL